jgi:hypothetical protein
LPNGGVPPRWLKCPRKADGFIAEKFLVFKTPLSARYNDSVPVQFRFPSRMIMDHMKMKKVRLLAARSQFNNSWIDDIGNRNAYRLPASASAYKYFTVHECNKYHCQPPAAYLFLGQMFHSSY